MSNRKLHKFHFQEQQNKISSNENGKMKKGTGKTENTEKKRQHDYEYWNPQQKLTDKPPQNHRAFWIHVGVEVKQSRCLPVKAPKKSKGIKTRKHKKNWKNLGLFLTSKHK